MGTGARDAGKEGALFPRKVRMMEQRMMWIIQSRNGNGNSDRTRLSETHVNGSMDGEESWLTPAQVGESLSR